MNTPSDKPSQSERTERERDRRFRIDESGTIYDAGGWVEYRRLILSELERINAALHDINDKIDDRLVNEVAKLKVDIGMLQVRSGVWGAVAGIITTIAFIMAAMVSGSIRWHS